LAADARAALCKIRGMNACNSWERPDNVVPAELPPLAVATAGVKLA
jgi:hypothetical protein